MTRRIGQAAAAGLLLVATGIAAGDWYITGDALGWDAGAAPLMTDNSDGTWSYTHSGTAGDRNEWQFLDTQGDWGSQAYGVNSWSYVGGGGDVTITIDTNTYADGWLPTTNRVFSDNMPTAWKAVGNWQDEAGAGGEWDLGGGPSMTDTGGGVFQYIIPAGLIPAGTYDWKPARGGASPGEWDSITADSSSTVGGGNIQFTLLAGEGVTLRINTSNGTVQQVVFPTPGAMALFGIGGIAATRRRRR